MAPTSIRIPPALRDRIEARAAAERRSVSGMVLYILEQTLSDPPREPGDSPFAGERLGALRLVLAMADLGLDADEIAEQTGLDRETIATLLVEP